MLCATHFLLLTTMTMTIMTTTTTMATVPAGMALDLFRAAANPGTFQHGADLFSNILSRFVANDDVDKRGQPRLDLRSACEPFSNEVAAMCQNPRFRHCTVNDSRIDVCERSVTCRRRLPASMGWNVTAMCKAMCWASYKAIRWPGMAMSRLDNLTMDMDVTTYRNNGAVRYSTRVANATANEGLTLITHFLQHQRLRFKSFQVRTKIHDCHQLTT